MKRYRLYWSAKVYGHQDVEAFDLDDAESQFDSSIIHDDNMPDQSIFATLDETK